MLLDRTVLSVYGSHPSPSKSSAIKLKKEGCVLGMEQRSNYAAGKDAKQAQKGGVCRKHVAKVKLCSREGCTNEI